MLINFRTLIYFCQCNSKFLKKKKKIVYNEEVQLLKDKSYHIGLYSGGEVISLLEYND
jgi:hypothetical protein